MREGGRTSLGICVLADFLVCEDILSGQLVRVLPQWNASEISVHVVYHAHRMLPARVRAFIDFAVSNFVGALDSTNCADFSSARPVDRILDELGVPTDDDDFAY